MSKKAKLYKTTKQDFISFKKWCEFYLKEFGINDWTIYYKHKDVKGCVASCQTDRVSRCLIFTLAKNPAASGKIELDIKHTALHEVLHALVTNLSSLVYDYCSEDEHRQAEEELVCKLTNIISSYV